MLMEIQSKRDIPGEVGKRLEEGQRIMGMGPAVYRTMDSRAAFRKEMGLRRGKKLGREKWPRLSGEIEQAALKAFEKKELKTLQPNVDFFSAPVYHLVGIPGDRMTPVFAVARIAGWCAHIIEEEFAEAQEKPALYRPQAESVGQYCGLMGCAYEAPDARAGKTNS
jgi:citrate synthase